MQNRSKNETLSQVEDTEVEEVKKRLIKEEERFQNIRCKLMENVLRHELNFCVGLLQGIRVVQCETKMHAISLDFADGE